MKVAKTRENVTVPEWRCCCAANKEKKKTPQASERLGDFVDDVAFSKE